VACFAGLALIFIACVLAASTVENGDLQTRMLGMLVGSMGAITASAALYIDARSMNKSAQAKKGRTLVCPQCRTQPAALWCINHSMSLCMDCLTQHHVQNTCLYRPVIIPGAAGRA
jgi:hypothetical protein